MEDRIRVGSIVKITVDYPDGIDHEDDVYVNGLIGVITDFDEGEDEHEPIWYIRTGPRKWVNDTGYAYARNQFEKATYEEIEKTLRMMLL